jgi:hypothetical protein
VTGGRYYAAGNAADFAFAAREATRVVEELPASGEGRVWLDEPAVFSPGGRVSAHFEAAETFHDHAWIGVVPSEVEHGSEDVNDQHDVSYEFIRGRLEGTGILSAPSKPGSYDVRLHDSDRSGREVAHATFRVGAAEARVWLDRQDYLAGQKMAVHFSATSELGQGAWIGIIPSEVEHGNSAENDRHDVGYGYVSGKSEGTVNLKAPGRAGSWDMRLHDSSSSDGNEIASVTFVVE